MEDSTIERAFRAYEKLKNFLVSVPARWDQEYGPLPTSRDKLWRTNPEDETYPYRWTGDGWILLWEPNAIIDNRHHTPTFHEFLAAYYF